MKDILSIEPLSKLRVNRVGSAGCASDERVTTGLARRFAPMSRVLLACEMACITFSPAVNASSSSEFKFFSRKGKVNTEDVRTVFKGADVLVSRLVPRPNMGKAPATLYNIVLMDNAEFKGIEIINLKGTEIRFHLPENLEDWIDDDKALSRLIEGILLKKLDLDPAMHSRMLPPWLVIGILGKLRARLCVSSIPGIRTYPAMKMLVTDDPATDLLKIAFSVPMYPDSNPMASVSIQTSDALLSAVMRLPGHREALRGLADLSVQGVDHDKAFVKIFAGMVRNFLISTAEMTLLQEKLDDYGMLREWFYDNAVMLSVNSFSPARAGFAERQFRKIEVVAYALESPEERKDSNEPAKVKANAERVADPAHGDSEQEIRYCSLNELQQKKNEIKNFPSIVKSKEHQLSRLEFSAPILLNESIREMRRALFNLRTDSSFKFEANFMTAKNKFFEQLQKCHDIERFMDEIESAVIPESWRFRSEIREIELHEERRRAVWPELSRYLDSIEEK